jgi:hypothetical protein
MNYKHLKNLLATIKQANIRGDNKITLPIKEANEIQNDIALLLLELKTKDSAEEKTIDGGKFD